MNTNYFTLSNIKFFLAYLTIFILNLISHIPLIRYQFHGEDEMLQLMYSSKILKSLLDLNIFEFFKYISATTHPPLRYLLSIPGIIIFPNTELGVRLVAIVFSFVLLYQIMKLGKEIGGNLIGISSGFLVATSAVCNWTSMAFSWNVITLMIILIIRKIRTDSLHLENHQSIKNFYLINFYLIITFLINTGSILFHISIFVLYIYKNIKNPVLLIKHSRLLFIFYSTYFLYFFLIVPLVASNLMGMTWHVGQFAHHINRGSSIHLNFISLIENFKGLNAYFFPYLSWILFLLSFIYLFIYEKKVFVFLSLYLFSWSFLLIGLSQQYFLLCFVAMLPFGIKLLSININKNIFIIIVLFSGFAFFSWNYTFFIKEYNEMTYPFNLFKKSFSQADQIHNIVIPYIGINNDLNSILNSQNKQFIHDLSGSFTGYYYNDRTNVYLKHLGHTKLAGYLASPTYPVSSINNSNIFRLDFDPSLQNIHAIVTKKEIAYPKFERVINYPNSTIKVYVINKES